MTAKEKAQLLFNQMLNTDLHCMTKYCAKKCAIVAVNELIKQSGHLYLESMNVDTYIKFLSEVKTELNNL